MPCINRQLTRLAAPFLVLLTLFTPNTSAGQLMVIIDDLGYNLAKGIAIAELPMPLAMAVVPFSPHGRYLAKLGGEHNKEIMLHSPMASIDGRAIDSGGLYPSMDRTTFLAALSKQLEDIPQATGVNNHMGSLLTQNAHAMGWLMDELAHRQLFFIDSRTSPNSIAYETAQSRQLASWSRDVFLDNERNTDAILKQLLKAVEKSEKNGLAVVIGHPYPETIEALSVFMTSQHAKRVQWITPSHALVRIARAQSAPEPGN